MSLEITLLLDFSQNIVWETFLPKPIASPAKGFGRCSIHFSICNIDCEDYKGIANRRNL